MSLLLFLIFLVAPQHCTLQNTISETTLTMTWHRCMPDSTVTMESFLPVSVVTSTADTATIDMLYRSGDTVNVFVTEQKGDLVGRYAFELHMTKRYLPLLAQ
jgi:hypothetical protein